MFFRAYRRESVRAADPDKEAPRSDLMGSTHSSDRQSRHLDNSFATSLQVSMAELAFSQELVSSLESERNRWMCIALLQ